MIYNEKEHYDLVFNQIQTLGFTSGFSTEYNRTRYEQVMAANGGKPIVKFNYLKTFGFAALGVVVAFILGVALKFILPCGIALVLHMIAAYLCACIGFIMIKSDIKQDNTFYKDQLSSTVRGIILILEAVAILAMWFNLPFETDAECSYFIAGTVFLTLALNTVISLIMHFTRGIRIYTRTVEAECIGYVRKKSMSTDADQHTTTHWYHSPVFKYLIDGREVIAFYDTLARGIDAKIPLGPCSIKVNKDDAGSVMNPSASGLIGSIIIIAVLLFFAYFFIAGVLQGGVSGTSISM